MSSMTINTTDVLERFGGRSVNDLTNLIGNVDEDNEMALVKHSPYYSVNDLPKALHTSDDNFLVISLNAQSINAKISEVHIFIHQLLENNIKADVLCIQESWLSDDADISQIQIDGYSCISQGHRCSSHGGLIVYVNSKYKHDNLNLYVQSDVWEGLFLEISGGQLKNNVIVGNIYKPPKNNNNNENIQTFVGEITPLLDYLGDSNKDIF